MVGKQQTSYEQEIFITQRASSGINASEIHREMEPEGLLAPPHPSISVRTVQNRVKKLSVRDTSGPWSLADADADQARLALDIVAGEFFSTTGRVWPSKDHVVQIVRVRQSVPDIPALWAYTLAQAYLRCEERGRDSRHLDFALGVRPWVGAFAADRIARALGTSRVFRVIDDVRGPLVEEDSAAILFALVAFQGSIEDMAARLEAELLVDPVPEPPEIILVDRFGEPRGLAALVANAESRQVEEPTASASPSDWWPGFPRGAEHG